MNIAAPKAILERPVLIFSCPTKGTSSVPSNSGGDIAVWRRERKEKLFSRQTHSDTEPKMAGGLQTPFQHSEVGTLMDHNEQKLNKLKVRKACSRTTQHTAYMHHQSDFASTHRSTHCNLLQSLEPLKRLDFDLNFLSQPVCCVWIQFWGLSDCLLDISMICTHSQSFIHFYFNINSHLPREKKRMLDPLLGTMSESTSVFCTHSSFLRTLTVLSLAATCLEDVFLALTVKNWVRVSNSHV